MWALLILYRIKLYVQITESCLSLLKWELFFNKAKISAVCSFKKKIVPSTVVSLPRCPGGGGLAVTPGVCFQARVAPPPPVQCPPGPERGGAGAGAHDSPPKGEEGEEGCAGCSPFCPLTHRVPWASRSNSYPVSSPSAERGGWEGNK